MKLFYLFVFLLLLLLLKFARKTVISAIKK